MFCYAHLPLAAKIKLPEDAVEISKKIEANYEGSFDAEEVLGKLIEDIDEMEADISAKEQYYLADLNEDLVDTVIDDFDSTCFYKALKAEQWDLRVRHYVEFRKLLRLFQVC
eukprot:g3661.t1